MKRIFFILAMLTTHVLFAQNVAINNDGSSPATSAMLDIKSTNKGLLIPRMTETQKKVIAFPATGLLIYQTDGTKGFQYFDGHAWTPIAPDAAPVHFSGTTGSWSVTGNTGTDATLSFIGTKDSIPFIGKANNKQVFKFSPTVKSGTFVGYNAGANNTGIRNTMLGYQAGFNNIDGSDNSFFGEEAGYANVTGDGNTAMGYHALHSNTSYFNTAIGSRAMFFNDSGTYNTAVGEQAMLSNKNGSGNTAVGASALYFSQNTHDNVVVGDFALYNDGFGSYNVAVGSTSMYSNHSGMGNTAVGFRALSTNYHGDHNIAIGDSALWHNVEGNDNIAIGVHSDIKPPNVLNNAIAIGSYAVAGNSNTMVLGGTGSYAVKVGIGTSYPLTTLHIKQLSASGTDRGMVWEESTGGNHWRVYVDGGHDFGFSYNNYYKSYINHVNGAYVTMSDGRLKKDVHPLGAVLPKLLLLSPKTYHYKDNNEGDARSYGFIAQEVESVFPEFVSTNSETGFKAVAYQNFSVVAIQAIKEQEQKIEALEAENKQLKKEVQQIKTKLGL